jgi:hypothetical protein
VYDRPERQYAGIGSDDPWARMYSGSSSPFQAVRRRMKIDHFTVGIYLVARLRDFLSVYHKLGG